MRAECVMSCLNVNVFFFKQKTAYKLRISDWSSDVCSSDLPARFEPVRVAAHDLDPVVVPADRAKAEQHPQHHPDVTISQIAPQQIGRASRRERVCQYV